MSWNRLWTTNSVCSVKIDDKVIFVKDLNNKNLIPSIVCFNKTIKVGNEIEISKNINDCVFSIKEILLIIQTKK